MSGIEAAGLALGFIPLLISAAEHYNKCLRLWRRYQNFTKKADRFLKLLGVQKARFTNQCRILLQDINIEHDVASSMLDGQSGVDHPFWSDVELEEQLTRLLGESRGECINTIELIRDRLGDIDTESQDLATAIDQDPRVIDYGQVYHEEMLMNTGYLNPSWKQIPEESHSQEAPLQLFTVATQPNHL